MKIVYIITQATWGGAQAHLYSLIKAQVMRGNAVALVYGVEGRLSASVAKEFQDVQVVRVASLVHPIAPLSDLKAIYTLRKLVKNWQPDIIHLHSSKAGMIGRLATIRLPMKVIFTVHGWGFTPGVGKKRQLLMKTIEKALSRLTTAYICVSQFDYDLGVQSGVITSAHPARVIHNGVTALVSAKKVNNTETFVLSMAARFDAPKRQDLLIQALTYLPENLPIVCHFLGDGSAIEACKTLTHQLNLDAKVRFYGVVDNVQKYYSQSDVGVLISDYEALPISLVEALAQGLPIIASNVGGIQELIDHNGFLVANDTQQIAEKILTLYQSKKLLRSRLIPIKYINDIILSMRCLNKRRRTICVAWPRRGERR
ncbi:glycosyltransferase family 4 protein [Lactiplantibacillus plantarum]|nr:glycosyltransferase family 4 protein [Lactiplantibacillus plantarum]WHQ66366.1 glycosyltransferase family 4 protein [Lactiplantibacillus plantarum]